MNMNERAAKCMGWHPTQGEWMKPTEKWSGWTPSGYSYEYMRTKTIWNPEHDYNHARMLYQRAIDVDPNATRDAISLAVYALSQTTDDFVTELDLTAQQFTEACCEVLEAHDDPN